MTVVLTCQHNCVPIGRTRITLRGLRKERYWKCIKCQGEFAADATASWMARADQDRADAIEFEQDVLRHSMDWDESMVGWNEHGAWYGCKAIHVIEEHP